MDVRLVDYSDSEEDDNTPIHTLPPVIPTSSFRRRECPLCLDRFPTVDQLQIHLHETHPEIYDTQLGEGLETNQPLELVSSMSAHSDLYQEFKVILPADEKITTNEIFVRAKQKFVLLMREKLHLFKNFKIQFSGTFHFTKDERNGSTKNSFPVFTSFLYGVYSEIDLKFVLRQAQQYFNDRIENFTSLGSNFKFQNVLSFYVTIAETQTFSAGAPEILPDILRRKLRTLVNVPGDENLCFKRAIHLHPALRPKFPQVTTDNLRLLLQRTSYYDQLFQTNTVDWSGIKFPFDLSQIKKFEKQNPTIGLCIIGFEDKRKVKSPMREPLPRSSVDNTIDQVLSVAHDDSNSETDETQVENVHMRHKKTLADLRSKCFLLYTCKEQRPISIDLLMNITENGNHFLFIKSLRSFLFRRSRTPMEVCRFCLHMFAKGKSHNAHISTCAELGFQKTSFPKEKFLKFKHFNRTIKIPHVVIADFEAYLKPVEPQLLQIGTQKLSLHCPGAYCFVCIDYNNEVKMKQKYCSQHEQDNVAEKMIRELVSLSEELSREVHRREEIAKSTRIRTEEQERQMNDPQFKARQKCFFCHRNFRPNDQIHEHHSHFDFKVEGLAHGYCNMQARQKKNELVIVMHNFKSYDSKLIVEGMSTCCDIIKDVEVIASSSEKFSAIFLKTHSNQTLKFIDSLSFFNASLDSLTKTMKPEDFNITKKVFEGTSEENLALLLRKGVYCYSYMDSVSKYKETGLPSKASFKNDLTNSEISEGDHEHACKVYEAFKCQNLGDYTLLYCMTDVTILADYFLKVRGIITEGYGLDICHYFSLPMLVYDAALKFTKVWLENIQDPSLYNFFEASIRGGLVSVGDLRVCKVNNPLLPVKEYDPSKPNTWCIFLDVTNLYGFCLKDNLPHSKYEWVQDAELEKMRDDPKTFFEGISDQGSVGYFVEVDVTIPPELHHKLNQFPPMPYKRCISETEITCEMNNLIQDLEVGTSIFKAEKLVADFYDRKKYICHYRALKQWIKLGCQITSITRAVKFFQCPWLKPLIKYNTSKRNSSTSEVESAFWKLASNSIFGKFIENKRMRVNMVFVKNREKGLIYNKKPTIQNVKIIHENLVLLTMKKLEVVLDRPIAVGATCLELSKTHMSKIYYDHVKRIWGEKCRNLYGDTDSFAIFVETDNVYEDMKNDRGGIFDMSVYDTTNPVMAKYHNSTNAKKLGCIKDELPRGPISGFAVLKPKMYAVEYYEIDQNGRTSATKEKKAAKGIPKRIVKNEFTFKEFADAIENSAQDATLQNSSRISHVNFNTIRSFDQILYTINQQKRGINAVDIKRLILQDNVNTLAFGHRDIPIYYM